MNSAAFQKILHIIGLYTNDRLIFVCSALNGVTDKLVAVTKFADQKDAQGVFSAIKTIEKLHLNTIDEIFAPSPNYKEQAEKYVQTRLSELQNVLLEIEEFGIEPYFYDYVVSFGEKLSTYLLYLYLQMNNIAAEYYTGEELIITDDNFTNALPSWKFTFKRFKDRIAPLLGSSNDKTIFCITGFIGRNKIGYTTTLGRGGSDFTATILSRCVWETCNNKRTRVILWKDVDGILTTNPKYVDNPTLVKKLNYKEASESAFFGAKILHPKCLAAIEKQKIKVEIKNFDHPEEENDFSIISESTEEGDLKGISTIEKMAMISVTSGTLVNVPGILGRIFTIMGDNNISVSMVAQSSSEVNTTFVVELDEGIRAVQILKNHPDLQDWFTVSMQEVGIIAIIGDQIHKSSHHIFSALHKSNLTPIAIAQSSDGLNISVVVDSKRIQEAVCAINEEFKINQQCES